MKSVFLKIKEALNNGSDWWCEDAEGRSLALIDMGREDSTLTDMAEIVFDFENKVITPKGEKAFEALKALGLMK